MSNDTRPVITTLQETLKDFESWTVTEDAIHHVVGQQSGSVGQINLNSAETPFSKYLINDEAMFSHQENDGTLDYGRMAGRITSVSPQASSASVTQSTWFQRFVADREIPAVSSGTAYGAIDLSLQLVSPRWACTLNRPGGVFWSLIGHDAGFGHGNVHVSGRDEGVPVAISQALLDYVLYYPKLVDYASVSVWSPNFNSGMPYAQYALLGSPYPEVGAAQFSMFVVNGLHGAGGSNIVQMTIRSGPESSNTGTGVYANVVIDTATEEITIDGDYRPGGVYTTFSVTEDISALDMDEDLQVAVSYGWSSATEWTIKAWVTNGDGQSTAGPVVEITTGPMNSNLDSYADVTTLSSTIGMRYLYQERVSSSVLTDSTVIDDYLLPYVDMSVLEFDYEPHSGVPGYTGGFDPIASYSGAVWDYLNMVLSVFGRTLAVDWTDGNSIVCTRNDTEVDIEFNNTTPPTLAVSMDSTGHSVEYELYETENVVNGVIYDAFETGEIWSVDAGEVNDIRIETGYTVTLARNPRGAYLNQDYESFRTMYGSYIVSGSDNLPIQDFQWVSYGGQVLVTGVGPGYIDLRLVGPPNGIPGVPGPYSLAISDGQNQYPRLTLIGAGVKSTTVTRTLGTGVSPEFSSVDVALTVNNPAISSEERLYTAHTRTGKLAAGPRVVLTGFVARKQFEDGGHFGLIQGSTFRYSDARWRVVSSTISELGADITAFQFDTQGDFEDVWSGMTQGDFEALWSGALMDDFHISPLRPPVN